MQGGKTIGFIAPTPPGTTGACNTALYTSSATCNDQTAPYTLGRMEQWGRPLGSNYSVATGAWPGVTGVTGTGWYWRAQTSPSFKQAKIDGAPSKFIIGPDLQIPRGHFIVLAVAYPPMPHSQYD